MKIGLPPHHFYRLDSVTSVFRLTTEILKDKFELLYFPAEYDHCSRERQVTIAREWLGSCDLILGPIDREILIARNEMKSKPPYICLLLGSMSRGARIMLDVYALLESSDVLVGNCTADLDLVNKFFDNATVALLPLAFDETLFYPLGEQERKAARASLNFRPEDNVLLYSGRITIEKNVHMLLKVFGMIEQILPHTHLLIAGTDFDAPFIEFGVYPLSVRHMLDKLITRLRIRNVRFLGQQNPTSLRALYNASDIAVNFTLHHDENFGLAQVEAMACGTPVAATKWGGLKDTVVDGVTGSLIGTTITGSGVKIDWWEAANKIIQLVKDTKHNENFRKKCAWVALEKYSQRQYRQNLDALLSEVCHQRKQRAEPLIPSEFALEFWYKTSARPGQPVPYRSSSQSYDMYRALMDSFAGGARNGDKGCLSPSQVLCLPVPVTIVDNRLEIEDPIYPFEITIPAHLDTEIRAIIDILKGEPVTHASTLMTAKSDLQKALGWLIEIGIVLVSTQVGKIVPRSISSSMAASLFTIQGVHFNTDIIYIQ